MIVKSCGHRSTGIVQIDRGGTHANHRRVAKERVMDRSGWAGSFVERHILVRIGPGNRVDDQLGPREGKRSFWTGAATARRVQWISGVVAPNLARQSVTRFAISNRA